MKSLIQNSARFYSASVSIVAPTNEDLPTGHDDDDNTKKTKKHFEKDDGTGGSTSDEENSVTGGKQSVRCLTLNAAFSHEFSRSCPE